jgi:hypothetical protein
VPAQRIGRPRQVFARQTVDEAVYRCAQANPGGYVNLGAQLSYGRLVPINIDTAITDGIQNKLHGGH